MTRAWQRLNYKSRLSALKARKTRVSFVILLRLLFPFLRGFPDSSLFLLVFYSWIFLPVMWCLFKRCRIIEFFPLPSSLFYQLRAFSRSEGDDNFNFKYIYMSNWAKWCKAPNNCWGNKGNKKNHPWLRLSISRLTR